MNLSTRFAVLRRDGFRCQYCGVDPHQDNTVTLEVDHIHPRSKGGSDKMANLTTACRRCNQGKRANDGRVPAYINDVEAVASAYARHLGEAAHRLVVEMFGADDVARSEQQNHARILDYPQENVAAVVAWVKAGAFVAVNSWLPFELPETQYDQTMFALGMMGHEHKLADKLVYPPVQEVGDE